MDGKVISEYGDTIVLKNGKNDKNRGVNIKADKNTDVLSTYDGKVSKCGDEEEYGNYVLIDHGEGIETLYSNLSAVFVKEGDEVKAKETIGLIKNDENNMDAELHFELKYMGQNKDPMEYLALGM
jgi:murein DD-endopeptidase MepM/ murein hydrolase activator NlpD